MERAAHVHLFADDVVAVLGRTPWTAVEGKCLKTLIVGTSRVLDFNIDLDLCALQTLPLPVDDPKHVAAACSSSQARQLKSQLHNQARLQPNSKLPGASSVSQLRLFALLFATHAQSRARSGAAQQHWARQAASEGGSMARLSAVPVPCRASAERTCDALRAFAASTK